MNKEYIYIDGKAIIADYNGYSEPIEYYQNLDEVLVQENVIEEMEKRLTKIKKEQSNLEMEIGQRSKLIKIILVMLILFISLASFMLHVSIDFNGKIISFLGYTLELEKFLIIFADFIAVTFGFDFGILPNIINNKGDKKEIKGLNSQITLLEKDLIAAKNRLNQLKLDKQTTQYKDNKFKVVKVNDKERLREIKNNLIIYYNCGYYKDKYLKYYEKGNLKYKLRRYNDKDVQVITSYIESEKSKSLVKK